MRRVSKHDGLQLLNARLAQKLFFSLPQSRSMVGHVGTPPAQIRRAMGSPPKKSSLKYVLNEDERDADRGRRATGVAGVAGGAEGSVGKSSRAGASSSGSASGSASGTGKEEKSSGTGIQKLLVCKRCSKTFVERGNLNKHITSVHLKERNKICPEPGCGKSFSFRDGLERHIAHVHQNRRQYKCELCDKAFKQSNHLAKHMRSIHKDRGQGRKREN